MKSVSWIILLGLIAGCEDRSTKKETAKSEQVATEPKADPKAGQKKEDKSDEEWTNELLGKWDGMQIKRNQLKTTTITGVMNLATGGLMTFDGVGDGRQTLIANGTWKVSGGLLTFTIESSNAPRLVPNGTSGAVKIREITEREFLYFDLTDMRTYSAVRTTDGARKSNGPSKKK